MSDNKVALITGASRGIGLGIATQLAKAGIDLAINGVRNEAAVSDVMAALRACQVKVEYCQGNIAIAADRKSILARVKEKYGRLDVLINNAGIAPKERRDILETTEESFDLVLDTNLRGPYFLTQAAANWMIGQKKSRKDFQGCIINISSISATVASPNRGEYCIAKAGMGMLSSLFAVRLGEFDIPVYEIRPGVIRTDMTAGVKEKYDKLIAEGLIVQNRWGMPEDVGRAAAALISGSFSYSTGQVFMIDGGLTIPRL